MESTLRAPILDGPPVRLFVCGLRDSLEIDHMFGLVVDCCGRGGDRSNGIVVRPSAGDHRWAIADLDRIVGAVVPLLRSGGRVNIHCRSGRSRSTTAAAAVLLDMGRATNPDDAVRMVALNAHKNGIGESPDRRSMASLHEWWHSRRQTRLF